MAHGTADWWSRTRALMDLDFKDLTDTPGSYAGKAGTVPEVTVLEDGLEFSDTVIDAHAARHENGGADAIDLGTFNHDNLGGIVADNHHARYTNIEAVNAILAGGAANLKLFINAAGDTLEWANGIKLGLFTRDISIASGTQEVSGVGFKPSNVIFFANQGNSVKMSIGIDNGTLSYGFAAYSGSGVAGSWNYNPTAIYIVETGGDVYLGNISVLGSDGFTINWLKYGTPTGTINIAYMAFR